MSRRPRRPLRRPLSRRLVAWCATACATTAVLVTAGCGFDAQTLQPYTQSDGVNVTVEGATTADPTLKIRNLMILADTTGEGFLSGSLIVDDGTDTLRSVSGVALNPNGSDGTALQIGSFTPISIGDRSLTVLTDLAPISVSGAEPGLEARLVLSFAQAGEQTVVVPVVDRTSPVYADVTPSADPTPSPSS